MSRESESSRTENDGDVYLVGLYLLKSEVLGAKKKNHAKVAQPCVIMATKTAP